MKQEKQNFDDSNCIEQKARKLFGYDEESLLAEMEEAERAWDAEKAADPETAAKAQRDADEGFEKLMDHIKAKGLTPVSEEDYEKEQQKNNRQVVGLSRRKKRVLVLAAVVCVLGLGMTMAVSGHRGYQYNLYPVEAKQNLLVKKNTVMRMRAKKLEDAYLEIEDTLGIKALKLGHVPSEMGFKEGIIDETNAIIELEYNGSSVYIREERYSENDGVQQLKMSDRKAEQQVYNDWLDKTMVIEENILQSGLAEYSTFLNGEGSYYSLSGKMEKTVFIEMVKGLYY